MRKYIIWGLAGLVTLASSCRLDLEPENTITSRNAFRTEKELNATTASIHFFQNIFLENDFVFYEVGELIDETADNSRLREWEPVRVLTSGYDNKLCYDMIFEANFLIDNIDRTAGLSEARRRYHLGQAYFALGLGYFWLSQRYWQAIVTENSTRLSAYTPQPQIEVIDRAIAYAQKAYDLLPTYDKLVGLSGTALTARQYASKGNTAALLSHLYAWRGSIIDLYRISGLSSAKAYKQAVAYASEIIEQKVGAYRLFDNPEELCQALSDPSRDNPEDIFSIVFDRYRSIGATSPLRAVSYVGWPINKTQTLGNINEVSYRLLSDKIKTLYPEGDLRREAFFYKLGESHEVEGKDYAILYKWRNSIYEQDVNAEGGESFLTMNANEPVWRLAGIYLLRAECYNKLGNSSAATADLNVIRRRSGLSDYPTQGEQDLKKAIFREMEREFIGEGGRYWDVLRNGYQHEELNGQFRQLSPSQIQAGALFLPLPVSTYRDKHGQLINPNVKVAPYWAAYKG